MKTHAAVVLTAIMLAARPGVATAEPVKFEIAAGDASSTLKAFSRQSSLQTLFDFGAVRNMKTHAIQGNLEPEAALARMLEGTGLTFEKVNDRTIAIRSKREDSSSSDADPAGQMRVASLDEESEAQAAIAADASESGRNLMVVRDLRDKRTPFVDGNADIPRTIDDAQPYYIFDGKEIRRSGASNLEAFLKQRLTMNTVAQTNSQVSATQQANPLGNTSTISLRGLEADKTLILVDGRKLAGVAIEHGFNQQPDINGIPVEAVERIEVLPSSASGIYGGSAIGGVVNVILKKDYQGGVFRLSYDSPAGTANGSQRKVSASYGFALEHGRTHVSASASWSAGRPLLIADRVGIFQANMDTILRNAPDFFSDASIPWLGSVPNIISMSVFTPVPEGTPGAFGPFPPGFDFGGGPTTAENPYLASTLPPLRLRDGTPLGSTITHLNAGTSPSASLAELGADALANAGRYVLDFPRTVQNPNGLLRPFGETPQVSSVMASVRRQMTSRLEAFAEFSIDENRSTSIDSVSRSYRVPAGAPTNPFGVGVVVASPNATRFQSDVRSRNTVATIGLRAQLPAGWMAMADYSHSENRLRHANNWFDDQAITDDMASGALDPFVDSLRYPVDLSRYHTWNAYGGSNRLDTAAVRGSGSLPALPWGMPTLTVGMEHSEARTPQATQVADYPINIGYSTLHTYFKRKSTTDSGYLETLVPLIQTDRFPGVYSLSAQLAGRRDRFTVDAGTRSSVTYFRQTPPSTEYDGPTLNDAPYFSTASYSSQNHTVGIKYQPISEVTLRVSRATAFLPPAPPQLIRNPRPDRNPSQVNDPVTGQDGILVSTLSGGNPDLVPQNSRSSSAGIIWEPRWEGLAGLRLNAEYYRIEQFNAIGSLTPQQIVDQEASFPGRVTRGTAGEITLVDVSAVNLFYRNTAGWDLSIGYTLDTALGRFDVRVTDSIIGRLENQYLQGDPAYDSVGFPSEGGAPRNKGGLTLGWARDRWTMGWAARYVSSYKQYGAAGGPSSMQYADGGVYVPESYIVPQGSDTIPHQTYHDLYLGYSFDRRHPSRMLQGTTVDLGVRNVFNRIPPFDVAYNGNFYLSPYEDIRLRSFWLNASRAF